MGSANRRRSSLRFLGGHESFSLRQGQQRRPVIRSTPALPLAALGILELLGTIALILPGILHSHTNLTVDAAIVLCVESLLFIWVHVKYTEKTPIIMSAVLGIIMAFIAYGRLALTPL